MQTQIAGAHETSGIQELNDLFNSFKRPYGAGEIVRFNLAYQRLYPKLVSTEKRQAEQLVDALLVDLEDKKLAATIYGVV